MTPIDGVEIKKLATFPDPRGFFREVIRVTDPFFGEGFAQWSHTKSYQGVVKAWHIHKHQVDWWYVALGRVKVALYDTRMSHPPMAAAGAVVGRRDRALCAQGATGRGPWLQGAQSPRRICSTSPVAPTIRRTRDGFRTMIQLSATTGLPGRRLLDHQECSMEPLILYILAAVLFVLGLAVVGGALFGRKRNQRLLLVAASAILWGTALLLYGCTSPVQPTETTPTPVASRRPPTATATLVPETATATLVPTMPPSPLVPSPTPK